ncbi:MAG TPA: cyclic nucleotide-binding domain-containing protein [Marmoricola sp.]|jgi:CRP-like cAMP-binding protein|nr:cyclic nucleotide-binding domain-containing protein [Marmoricola sp.]
MGLPTVERVARLRDVDLFASTPDRVLAGLAAVVEEVDYADGAVLIEAGAVEDWLFVVVSGEVQVTRADRTVRLGPGSVVGELAVLDPQPRSATVTALGQVQVFRLSRAAFDDVVHTRPELATGVITELVRRLRESHRPPGASSAMP